MATNLILGQKVKGQGHKYAKHISVKSDRDMAGVSLHFALCLVPAV